MVFFSFQKFSPINLPGKDCETVEVGDYWLTSETSRTNRVMYYVVKIIALQQDDKALCEWYTFKDKEKLFVKIAANWEVYKEGLLRKVEKPTEVGRRKRVLFQDVYKFLVGSNFEL